MGKVMNKIRQVVSFQCIADDYIDKNKTQVLHISDTPSEVHPKFVKLIQHIKPDYVIHTGDLVDDIKIGDSDVQTERYVRLATKFIQTLLEDDIQLLVTPGNHDCMQTLYSMIETMNFQLVAPYSSISIADRTFQCSHYVPDLNKLSDSVDYFLYGHNYQHPADWQLLEQEKKCHQSHCKPEQMSNVTVLNGVEAISLIQIPDDRVFRFPYPRGTDHLRKYNQSMRLL